MNEYPRCEEYVRKYFVPYVYCNECGNPILQGKSGRYKCMYCNQDRYKFQTHKDEDLKEISDFDFDDLVKRTQEILNLDKEKNPQNDYCQIIENETLNSAMLMIKPLWSLKDIMSFVGCKMGKASSIKQVATIQYDGLIKLHKDLVKRDSVLKALDLNPDVEIARLKGILQKRKE